MTTSIKEAKALARHLAEALKVTGQELPHSNMLEVVAKSLGARNWHAFQASADQLAGTAAVTAPTVAKPEPWNRLYGAKTQAQFLDAKGGCCPVCGSDNIEGDGFTVEGNTCFQEVSCMDCDAEWYENYDLASYTLDDDAKARADEFFIESVTRWLEDGMGEELQFELDDVIVDWFASRKLSAVNGTPDPAAQGRLLDEGDTSASDINNEGVEGQVSFLWEELKTRKAVVEYLAERMDLDIAKLKFLPECDD